MKNPSAAYLRPSLAIITLVALFGTAASAATRSWPFGDGNSYEITHPDEAEFEQVSPPEDTVMQAFTIRMPDADGISTISYQMLVTHAETADDWSDIEKIDAFLHNAGQRGLRNAVETELIPVHLAMANGVGSYIVFTDPSLVGQTIDHPGEFRHMVMLAGRVGDFTIFARGYTNSTESEYFKAMNRMLESSRIIPPKSP